MLVSQDSSGAFRVFSLERGDWTSVGLVGLEEARKAWVIGMMNHDLIFWRITSSDPEPTVAPRFSIEKTSFYIPTIGIYIGDTQ